MQSTFTIFEEILYKIAIRKKDMFMIYNIKSWVRILRGRGLWVLCL